MADEVSQFNYRAFIAFDTADQQWADELQRSLDITRIAPELVGRDTPVGPVPRELKPIFRYGETKAEQPALSDEAATALAGSLFLVVLCSPDAASNPHVNEVVRRFKMAGRRDRLVPVVIAGAPHDPERECFPPALRCKLSDQGAVTSEPEDPVAPLVIDGRAAGDGRQFATLKLSAALAGLDLATYLQADAAQPMPPAAPLPHYPAQATGAAPPLQPSNPAAAPHPVPAAAATADPAPAPRPAAGQQPPRAGEGAPKRRSRRGARLVTVLVLIAALAAAIGWLRFGLPRNPSLLDAVLESGTHATTRVVEVSERLGLPRALTHGLVNVNEAALSNLADWGGDSPALRYRKAAMLLAFARDEELLGHSNAARERLTQAGALLGNLAPNDRNPALDREVALAEIAAGSDLLTRSTPDEALKLLRPGVAALERRAAANPGDAERQRDVSVAMNALGDALLAKGMIDEAFQRYREALTVRERLVVRDPKNEAWRRDLSVSHERIGDVLLARSELNDALKAYRTSLALRLAAVDPETSGGAQRQLAVAYNKIGDVLVARGALDEALNNYRAALALQLAAAHPDDAARRDLAISYERIGDVLKTQRAWDEALAAYRASLLIRERLAAADPGNARWARDLPVSHERIGDVLMARGALAEALAAYRTSLALRERLADADRGNVALQRDAAISYNKIGDVLAAQGASDEAVKNYRAGLAIREKLVALDPTNAQLQWDLLVLQWRLASSGDDPATRFGLIVSTLRELAAKRQLSVEQARWLPAAEQELARVRRP